MREPRRLISSELLALEAERAAVRLAAEHPGQAGLVADTIHNGLRRVSLVALDGTILSAARAIPQVARSLDALHLATAEWLGDLIECVVTYDATTPDRPRDLASCCPDRRATAQRQVSITRGEVDRRDARSRARAGPPRRA